jgi:hypothetical protein
MAWRLARSLEALRAEVNNRAPGRSKTMDGTVGDLAHQKRGKASDHNPDAAGVVRAIDFTHDPGGGLDCNTLAAHLIRRAQAGDARVKYLIWDGRIWNLVKGGAWRPYTGRNPHTKHLHLSVSQRPELYDLGTPWGWRSYRLGQRVLRKGDRGPRDVAELQLLLNGTGLVQVRVDDDFGPATDAAVRTCQHSLGVPVDGVVGPQTIAALEDPLPALTPDEQRELLTLVRTLAPRPDLMGDEAAQRDAHDHARFAHLDAFQALQEVRALRDEVADLRRQMDGAQS